MDTGIGIRNNRNLFKSFTQGDSSSVKEFGGIGIGLTIAKKLTELMGGDITAQELEKGSCFVISLPLQVDQSDCNESSHDLSHSNVHNKADLKILVVEDNEISLVYVFLLFHHSSTTNSKIRQQTPSNLRIQPRLLH